MSTKKYVNVATTMRLISYFLRSRGFLLFFIVTAVFIGILYAHSVLIFKEYEETFHGLEDETIKNYFPDDYAEKLIQYKKIGDREKVSLKTGNDLFVRYEGCTLTQCKQLLDRITPSGPTPEPLRIAQLLAKTILTN